MLTSHRAVLTVDVRDAVGDRMHVSDEFKKDGVSRLIALESPCLSYRRVVV